MYQFFSKISTTLSEPFSIFAHSFSEFPFLVAIFLGIVGAVAPCQLTGNISAITYYGNRTIQKAVQSGQRFLRLFLEKLWFSAHWVSSFGSLVKPLKRV